MLLEVGALEQKLKEQDFGFRVYRLDSSSLQDVYLTPQQTMQTTLHQLASNIKPDRTPEDLLAHVMLDWGLPLSLRISEISVEGKRVFTVAGDSLYACFGDGIDEAFARAIAPHKPLRMVFRDGGFASDDARINIEQIFKQLSPGTEVKVI